MTRITGSVPDGRSTTRPRSPRRPSASRHGFLDLRRLARIEALRDPHVDHHLRKPRHPRGQLREAASGRLHDREHLQRADQPVAGRRLVEAQQVARGLAAEHAAVLAQHLQHVAVADRRATERDALLRARARARDCSSRCRRPGRELLPPLARARHDVEQLVAIDGAAEVIDHHQPVAVAIERDAGMRRTPGTVSCSSSGAVDPQRR